LKILLVQPMYYLFSSGGAHKANRILVEGLAERGHSCRVITPRSSAERYGEREQFLADLAERGIGLSSSSSRADVFHHRGVEVHAVAEVSQLRSYLVEQVHAFNPTWTLISEDQIYAYGLLEAALEADPSRVVYISHSPATMPFGPGSFVTSASKTALLHRTAGIITVSQYLQDYLLQWGGLGSALIRFPVYGPLPSAPLDTFSDGLVMMINPSIIKGLSLFLEMAKQLPHLQFGAVPTWGTSRADRARMSERKNVQVVRAEEDVNEIFKQTKILVVPSLWAEAFGQVVVEAMMRGIPVVASDSGGLREAKLGVDYVVPVQQILRYEERLDEQLLPIPVLPEQEVGGWVRALRELSASRSRYEQVAAQSYQAARGFVSELGIDPFEQWFLNLTPRMPGQESRHAMPLFKGNERTRGLMTDVQELSPERRALLALRLKEKARRASHKEAIE
jgi:glycosyltransferase involved in cell wall biosynthesis